MKLRLRLFWLFLLSFWKRKANLLDEVILSLRVLPNDVELKKVSNDRYIALMDLGRADIGFRCGLRKAMLMKNWTPVTTFCSIRYRYPLQVIQKYELRTRVIWWDEETFYWKQTFKRNNRTLASAYVAQTLYNSDGVIPSARILEEAGQSVEKPVEPDIIAKLYDMDNFIHDEQRD